MEKEKQGKKCRKTWLIVALILALYSTILTTYMGLKIGVFDPKSPINQQPLVHTTITKKYAKNLTYEKAQKTAKPVLVLFYTDWCKFCNSY